MKIGCSSLTLMNYWRLVLESEGKRSDVQEPDVSGILRVIEWAAGLGFTSAELWIASDEHFGRIMKGEIRRIRQACLDRAISPDYLTCDFTAKWLLTKPTSVIEKQFDRIAAFANALDIKTLASVSPSIPSTAASQSDVYPGAPPVEVKILPGFSWEKSWNKYTQRVAILTKVLRRHSLNLALEPRPREILGSTDSLLRLFERVRAENLGGIVDTSHMHIIREVPAISIYKMGKKLFEFQASENDGITAYHWAPGQGEVDWRETLEALGNVGFNGAVCIDVTGINMEAEILDGKVYIEEMMKHLSLLSGAHQWIHMREKERRNPVTRRPRNESN